jgi:hypothetical protein
MKVTQLRDASECGLSVRCDRVLTAQHSTVQHKAECSIIIYHVMLPAMSMMFAWSASLGN